MVMQSGTFPDRARTETEKSAFVRMQGQLKERRELLAELEPNAAPHIDPVAWSVVLSARAVIAQIETALRRLEAGTYGVCTSCGDAIDPDRLEIFLYTEACIPCQNGAVKP